MLRAFFVLFAILGAALLPADVGAQNTISTIAGGALPDNVAPTAAGLEGVYDVVRDSQGDLYIITDIGVIYKISSTSPGALLTIYAGNTTGGYSGDGGQATAAKLNEPFSGALDANGNLYFSDSNNCVVRKITLASGIISTVVGTGACDYTGDGGPATSATLDLPQGIAIDPAGNLFIVDYFNDVIRRVDASTQIITTFAGNGNVGYTGDGGPALQATLNFPEAVVTDANGNLFIADSSNNVVRFVNVGTNIITTVAGTGTQGYSGDGGPATSALFFFPSGLGVDQLGNLYVSDTNNAVVRKVDANHTVTTIIGNHGFGFGGDGGPALSATLTNPFGLAVDAAGDVWVADLWNNRVRMYSASSQALTTVAGDGLVGDGGPATSASLYFPRNPALDSQGDIYITDEGNNRIRRVDAQSQVITTVAGMNVPCPNPTDTCGDGGPAVAAAFFNPHSVGLDPTQTLLIIADTIDNRVREVNIATGIITTIAGTGNAGFTGDGGPATSAEINSPRGFAYDSSGNLYFVDTSNHRIRKIDKTTGVISTVAGSGGFAARSQGCGNGGYTGDGGPATSATMHCPLGVAIDANNNIYIADDLNNVIREVDATTQIITTIAGIGTAGYSGDNGPATSATLSSPDRVSVNGAGNLFISDSGNNVIRRVDGSSHIITTFAGNGTLGFSGDGGPALAASLAEPTGVVVIDQGFLYMGDLLNNRIRLVTLNPAVTLSNNSVAFGNQAINSTSPPQIVTVTNSGDSPLNIASVTPSGDFSLSANTCDSTLAVGAQCTLSITFTPSSFGALTGAVTVTDDAPAANSTQTINLSGTGAALLTVALAGNGSGTVSSNPPGITCGATCIADFNAGTVVTLTAVAGTNSTFAGWSGACTNLTGTCAVALSQNQSVTATFTLSQTTTLVSIGVTPANPTEPVNSSLQFTATGTFSDDSTKDITSTVVWASSNTTAATISKAGLATTGVSGNLTTTISATQANVRGSTLLTVSGSPLTIVVTPPAGGKFPPVPPGGKLAVGIVLTATAGFSGPVTFGCMTSSPTITCQPDPASVILKPGGPTQVAIVLNTFCTGITSASVVPMRGTFGGGLGLLLLATALTGLTRTYKQSSRWVLSSGLLVLLALGGAACSSLPKGPNGVTPPGNYSVTFSATANGSTTSTVPINFTVE